MNAVWWTTTGLSAGLAVWALVRERRAARQCRRDRGAPCWVEHLRPNPVLSDGFPYNVRQARDVCNPRAGETVGSRPFGRVLSDPEREPILYGPKAALLRSVTDAPSGAPIVQCGTGPVV